MTTDRLHVVTGAPGTGKSTLVAALAAAGVATSEEIGRRIIREQVAAGGSALRWDDEVAFAELMWPREVAAHAAALATGATVVLDRGVPDVVAFLRASRLPVPPAIDAAARAHRYNPRVVLARHLRERRRTPPPRRLRPGDPRGDDRHLSRPRLRSGRIAARERRRARRLRAGPAVMAAHIAVLHAPILL